MKIILPRPINEELSLLSEELKQLKRESILKIIIEGVDDPGILKCVFLAGGPGCFIKDTLVRTQNGYKPIQNIEEGELVYTINEKNGIEELKPVIQNHAYNEHTEDLLELEFEDGSIVRCTENHQFYVDGEWIAAKNLDILKRKTNLGKCKEPVYDLTVLDNSNYQITKRNIIVHNSGKSFVANEVFGVPHKFFASFSFSGLKLVNSDKEFERRLKINGIEPKELATIEKEDPELWDIIQKGDSSIRGKAKRLTIKMQKFYEAGRLGLVIDGTGRRFSKIQQQKDHAESLGYDTYMLFVNTSLDVAMERNKKRDRVLADDLVASLWKDVQQNMGKFQNLFGSNAFTIVDNTEYGPIDSHIQKEVNKFVRKPLKNSIGKKWVDTARELKNKNLIK